MVSWPNGSHALTELALRELEFEAGVAGHTDHEVIAEIGVGSTVGVGRASVRVLEGNPTQALEEGELAQVVCRGADRSVIAPVVYDRHREPRRELVTTTRPINTESRGVS